MRRVGVLGIGQTPFRARWPDKTYYELAFDAARAALLDASLEIKEVDSFVYGIYNEQFERQIMPDVYVHDYIGAGAFNKPMTRVACGGATGGFAVRMGFLEVASGAADICMVLGVEKCNDNFDYETGKATPEVLKSIAYSCDMTYEFALGSFAASNYALTAVAHIEKYGTPTEEQMALVSIKNHANALGNPYAQSGKQLTIAEVMGSRMICYPFRFYHNCLYSEAAAVIILASEDVIKKRGRGRRIWITGVGASVAESFTGNRDDLSTLVSTRVAAERAYKMAGITNPRREIDFIEVHDAFASVEPMAYEEFGLAPRGKGGELLEEGVVMLDGDIPCCPSGGLIGCGHAVGATGVMQTNECVVQLRGEGGARQVKKARRGMVHGIGGPGACYSAVMILEVDK